MEGFDKKDGIEKKRNGREEIFSRVVRAGKRTYFFDVKATRKDDYYLTITESKKRFEEDGRFRFEKHKLFLYKEDFEKFTNGLKEVIEFIQAEQGLSNDDASAEMETTDSTEDALSTAEYTNVDFEDLNQE